MKEKKINQQYGLYLKIFVCDNRSLFTSNPKKFVCKYSILEAKDNYLVLKKDHKSFANLEQYILEREENLIFNIIKKGKSFIIKHMYDKNILVSLDKYFLNINNMNFRLWKSIIKYEDEKIINDKNKCNYIFELNENSIIRLGNAKLILREFHIFGKNEKRIEKKNNIFTIKLKNEKNKICVECGRGFLGSDDPLVKLCNCNEYIHFSCKKKKIDIYKDENNGCICYSWNTNCSCGKFYPLSFYVEEINEDNDKNKRYNYYELIDIPRNKDEDYLLFEELEFQDTNANNIYKKCFYYVQLDKKDKTKIMLGAGSIINDEGKYNYDKMIKINESQKLSKYHAIIEYDKKTQKLNLRNISDTLNTLAINNCSHEFELKKDNHDDIIYELGNIKIEAKLITKDEFEKVKEEINQNPVEVKERNDLFNFFNDKNKK